MRTPLPIKKHYDSKISRKIVRQVRTIHHSKPSAPQQKVKSSARREEEVDKELEDWTIEELRDEIDHLYKLRQAFLITKMKINNTGQRK